MNQFCDIGLKTEGHLMIAVAKHRLAQPELVLDQLLHKSKQTEARTPS